MMGTSLQEKMAALSPERQERIRAAAERLQAEHMTMQALRKARQLTQMRMAKRLGKTQVTIAQLEKRTDVMLSTLRSYIEAMGGQLELVVRFPDSAPVILQGLSDEEEPVYSRAQPRRPMRGRKSPRKTVKTSA